MTTDIMLDGDTDYKTTLGGTLIADWLIILNWILSKVCTTVSSGQKCLTTGSSGGLREYCDQHIDGITEGKDELSTLVLFTSFLEKWMVLHIFCTICY